MNTVLIPDLCRLVRSYLFDSVTLPALKVTISGFCNGLFYVTYKDITVATTLNLERYRKCKRWGWEFQGAWPVFFLWIDAHAYGSNCFVDYTGYFQDIDRHLSAEELGNLFTFVQRQLS